MSPLWAIPAIVSSLGAVGVYALARSAVDEARELAKEIGRFGELRPALVTVRDELASSRRSLEARGRR